MSNSVFPAKSAASNNLAEGNSRTRRISRVLMATLIAGTVSAVLPNGADAATKVTTKATTKSKSKSKVTTTKKRTAPKPAKGSSLKSGLWAPNGRQPAAALNFDPNPPSGDKNYPSAKNETEAFSKVQTDGKTLFVLLIGSDARPGEKVERSRADAIHLFAYNPTLKKGTLIGFPRDTWVTAPNGDQRKINEVLSVSGPEALLSAFNSFTGLNVQRYVITGFDGFKQMVDGVGGINVEVKPLMNDPASAAQFQQGWFQMNGRAALAFSRARKTLPKGDFDRSANQNKLLVSSLYRLRESTDNVRALLNWVYVGRRNTVSNIKPGDWMYFAQVSRAIDPTSLSTTVIQASPQTVGDQEVVVANEDALANLMADVADGVLGN